jgi:hypothetical protein
LSRDPNPENLRVFYAKIRKIRHLKNFSVKFGPKFFVFKSRNPEKIRKSPGKSGQNRGPKNMASGLDMEKSENLYSGKNPDEFKV